MKFYFCLQMFEFFSAKCSNFRRNKVKTKTNQQQSLLKVSYQIFSKAKFRLKPSVLLKQKTERRIKEVQFWTQANKDSLVFEQNYRTGQCQKVEKKEIHSMSLVNWNAGDRSTIVDFLQHSLQQFLNAFAKTTSGLLIADTSCVLIHFISLIVSQLLVRFRILSPALSILALSVLVKMRLFHSRFKQNWASRLVRMQDKRNLID